MFGEHYFAARERLSAVVRGVRRLADDTGTDAGPLTDEGEFLADLDEPFIFLVCGEINAGKSAFLNGLFGVDFCESDAIPTTKKVCWYRYGRREFEEEQEDGVVHCFRDHEFLLDFSVVDTPGLNGLDESGQKSVKELIEKADLVFFVFPVTNAWSAPTWNFVAEIGEEVQHKAAVVLQQKDLRNDEDMAVMMEHVGELGVHKIGKELDVFPVSAALASEAKSTPQVPDRLIQASGYPALERFVSRKVAGSPQRRDKLREIQAGTLGVLREIEDRMEVRRRTLDSDQGFLSDVETEVENERAEQAARLAEKFNGLGEVFGEQAERAASLLAERTSVWPSLLSLFKKDETPAEIEKGLIEAVKESVERLAANDSDELVEVCRGHWRTVESRVEERLEMPPPDFEEESSGFAGAKERFAKRLGGAARKAVVAQKVRGMLDAEMEARRDTLRRSLILSLLLVTGAGVLGVLHLNWIALLALAVAVIILVLGLSKTRESSQELVDWFRERTSACRRPFAEDLSEEYQEGVRGFFVEYATMFEGIRRHVADLKMKLKPQLDQWSDYFLELNAIEQDL